MYAVGSSACRVCDADRFFFFGLLLHSVLSSAYCIQPTAYCLLLTAYSEVRILHSEVLEFIGCIKGEFPDYFSGVKVVELGSLDINGTVRDLFKDCEYVGIDRHGGRGVDIVSLVHEVGLADGIWDVVVTTEMLEHDPYWRASLRRAVDLLRVGGLLIITCGSQERGEHNLEDSPVMGYYRGLSMVEVSSQVLSCGIFKEVFLKLERSGLDIYCYFLGKV